MRFLVLFDYSLASSNKKHFSARPKLKLCLAFPYLLGKKWTYPEKPILIFLRSFLFLIKTFITYSDFRKSKFVILNPIKNTIQSTHQQ